MVLHVPHIPSWHDEGSVRPACAAAASSVVSSSHSRVRPLRRSSTVYVGPVDPATSAAGAAVVVREVERLLVAPLRVGARLGEQPPHRRHVRRGAAREHLALGEVGRDLAQHRQGRRRPRGPGPPLVACRRPRRRRRPGRRGARTRSAAAPSRKMMSAGRAGVVHEHDVDRLARGRRIVRSIDISGVMPLPADRKRYRSAGWLRGAERAEGTVDARPGRPAAGGRAASSDTGPPGTRLTVMRQRVRPGGRRRDRVAALDRLPVDLDGEREVLAGVEPERRGLGGSQHEAHDVVGDVARPPCRPGSRRCSSVEVDGDRSGAVGHWSSGEVLRAPGRRTR